MSPQTSLETPLDNVVLTMILIALWSYGLWFVITHLKRSRPDLMIGRPIALGFVLRLIAIPAVTATGLSRTLRGGDELVFLADAHTIASQSFASDAWLPGGKYPLHEILLALQIRLGDFSPDTMRVTQIGLAALGATLIAAAVYDLGGARAAGLCALLLALEPSSVFFSELLHKEAPMILASGLVVFGGAKTWGRISPFGLLLMLAGSLMGVATRPYAGWFLSTGAVLVALHAAFRQLGHQKARSLPVLAGVVVVIIVSVPAILQLTSHASLQANLQSSQNANVGGAGSPGNNLALEQVDFSTRSAIVTNLPQRIRDLLLRPYPWQLGNTSQRVGVIGTLLALLLMVMLLRLGLRTRGSLLATTGPVLYPVGFLLLAYALSVGNAGTGFRYRTHLVALGIAIFTLLRARVNSDAEDPLPPARLRLWPRRRGSVAGIRRAEPSEGRP